jgi:hypothetical protein
VADPLTTFDLARFHAIRAYQAQQGREVSRCLKELRQLRREPRLAEVDAHEQAPAIAKPETRNEPGKPVAAALPNEPEAPIAAPSDRPAVPSPMPSATENEPETRAGTDLSLLQPRYPVPLPDPLEQALRQELEAAVRAEVPDTGRLLALDTRRLLALDGDPRPGPLPPGFAFRSARG